MNIRKYMEADIDGVVAIFRSNIPKYFTEIEEPGLYEFLDVPEHVKDYYVLELDGQIVGAGGIEYNDIDPPTVSLCWGMVHKDHLSTGLGKELTKFRIELSGQKFPGIPLAIGTSQHTEGFYEKFGFRTVEHTKDGYGPGIDMCRMLRDI
jgi:predicted GNAT family N-acyltransferase